MSTPFYDLASLVVVPSGYKASKVYAQKPLTTDGQLTFSRASTATRVNASGLIETVSSGVPRLDYQGSTCPKLLLEPQRTNLLTYSQQFDDAAWTKSNATVTANTSVSPDGTQNADTVVITSSGYIYRQLTSYSAVSGQSVAISIFAKNQINNFLFFGGATPAGTDVYKIENYGNGWYRHSVVRTFTTTTTGTLQYLAAGIVGTHIVWGAQIEGSNSAYATSYIPTTTAAVTRSWDDAGKTGITSLIGQTAGTLFVQFNADGRSNAVARVITYLTADGTTSNRIGIQYNASGQVQAIAGSGGTTQGAVSYTITGACKAAFAYNSSGFEFFVNGVSRGTFTGTLPTSLTRLELNSLTGTFDEMGGSLAQVLIFKSRLTNAQLAELTTL